MAGAAEDIVAWSVSVGLDGLDQGELVARYCERLVGAGVPLWRASIGADTLHPLIVAQGHRWLAGEGVHEEFFARARNPEGENGVAREPVVLADRERRGADAPPARARRGHQRVPPSRGARCPGRHRLLDAGRAASATATTWARRTAWPRPGRPATRAASPRAISL